MAFLGMSAESLTVQINIHNDSKIDRKDEPVTIQLKDVPALNFQVAHAAVKDNGKLVPVQLDDMDGDYCKDELFFLTDIRAKEKKTFTVTLTDEVPQQQDVAAVVPRIYTALQIRDKKDLHPDVSRVEAPGKTNIYNDIYMHGITIESEYVGYRIYFDERQNIDLYGKKKKQLEIATTQFYTTAEQLAEGYGTDVLWAGKAIGCGSFKRFRDGEPENWTGDVVDTRGEHIVTTGPLRTVVEVYDLGMLNPSDVPGKPAGRYDVRQRYTLCAGHRDVKVDVQFSEQPNHAYNQFCTGVQKVGVTADDSVRLGHTPAGYITPDGVAASWGCDYPDMGKKQLWGPEAIGMAVYVPKQYIRDQKEDDINYIYAIQPVDREFHYWLTFCCAKEETDSYHTSKEWFDYMKDWKENITNPVKVTIK